MTSHLRICLIFRSPKTKKTSFPANPTSHPLLSQDHGRHGFYHSHNNSHCWLIPNPSLAREGSCRATTFTSLKLLDIIPPSSEDLAVFLSPFHSDWNEVQQRNLRSRNDVHLRICLSFISPKTKNLPFPQPLLLTHSSLRITDDTDYNFLIK